MPLPDGELDARWGASDRVLLMRKKRGVGAVDVQRPGREGRTRCDATGLCGPGGSRKFRVTVHDLEKLGEHRFAFGGDPVFFYHNFDRRSSPDRPSSRRDDAHGLMAIDAAGTTMQPYDLAPGVRFDRTGE